MTPMPYLSRYQIEQIRKEPSEEIRQHIANLHAEIENLYDQRNLYEQEIEELRAYNQQLTALVENKNQQIQQNETQISNLQQQIQTLNAQISNLEQQLEQLQGIIPLWNGGTDLTQSRTLSRTVPSWGFWINGTGTWSNRAVISYITSGTTNYQYITPVNSSSLWGLWIPDGRLWVLTSGGQEFDIPNVSSVTLQYSSMYEQNSVIFQYSS